MPTTDHMFRGSEVRGRLQVVGDGRGVVKAFGERECSVQRRHQKVVEESPSPFVDDALRKELCTAAEALCASASYRSAGCLLYTSDAADE